MITPDKTEFEILLFLYGVSKDRVYWYRSEMWKITLTLYAALAGLIMAVLQFGHGLDNKLAIAITVFIIGVSIIYGYYKYLDSLVAIAKACNDTLELREKYIISHFGMSAVDGYLDKHTCYKYLSQQKPGLERLFVAVAVALLCLSVLCLWLV